MTIFYKYFYQRLSVPYLEPDSTIHLLNPSELKAVRRLERKALIVSCVIGILSVLFLYLPQYRFPQFFLKYDLNLPVLGKIELPIVATIYGIILVFFEIWALTLVHIYCIHHIAIITGYISHETKHLPEKQKKILAVSTEEKDKTLLNYGINPHQGLRTSQVWLFNFLISLKATLTNMLVKMIVRRFLGRYAVREVLDLLGIPVFAFWNMMATRTILREARVMIMGQNLIDAFLPFFEKIAQKIKGLPETKPLIYDTLQFIAICKRDYHSNHVYLTTQILALFDIPIEKQHLIPSDYAQRLAIADPTLHRFCQLLIVLGLLLDGQISYRERKRVQIFYKDQILELSVLELIALKNDFLEGRSIMQLTDKFLLD